MRVIGYVRVSTDEQARDGISLASQRDKVAAYAKLYDLELVEVVEDAGESAKSLNRPGLKRALAALKAGKADGLVVVKLDRLTRSIADWQKLIDTYFGEKPGKRLFSVGDSIDTRTAAGRMVLNMLLTVAQWEREIIGERTREALRFKVRRGERCSKTKFGYELAADGITWTPNRREQEAIAIMERLRQEGESYGAIAAELNRRGIPTKTGKRWGAKTIWHVLNRAA